MKSKVLYSLGQETDFQEARRKERLQTEKLPIPKNVSISEKNLGEIPTEFVTAKENKSNQIVFYIHGGGFVLGEAKTRRAFTTYLAGKMHYNVAAINYRLAPEHPFPRGAEDCLTAYEALLKQFDAKHIIFVGESAGGNLVLSTLLQAKERKLPLPAAIFAIAPTVQYDKVFPSYTENLNTDCMVGYLSEEVRYYYLCERKEIDLKNPIAAPYYGNYSNCPPIFLWASNSEVLRDDSIYLYNKLKEEGQPCELYLRDKMLHTYMTIPTISEARKDLKIMKKCMDDIMEGKKEFGNKRVELH